MKEKIALRIRNLMNPVAAERVVADVRIGLSYTSVRLDDGHTGVAWTGHKHCGCCSHHTNAGTLAGRPAGELLDMVVSDSPLFRTIGLATANALASGIPGPERVSTDILELIGIRPSEHVAMVGFFGPLIPHLKQTGCRLDILELNEDKPGTMTPLQGEASLAACDVAIITATSVVTDTIDELLNGLGNVRAAVILGPSSFMRTEVFSATPVTHIAGVRVRNASAVEKIISEGGGTKSLKPHMDFETLCIAR